ncbi:hypothetical protein HMPREF1619_00382 [Klebsiella pneumoniae 909957]|nr:hypothetical protein HMPREF1619_00382 [Klebsiella pneumoniae 909957]
MFLHQVILVIPEELTLDTPGNINESGVGVPQQKNMMLKGRRNRCGKYHPTPFVQEPDQEKGLIPRILVYLFLMFC